MAALGHEHAFPRPRANGWCRFSQGTLPPGRVATGRGAPKSVMRIGTGQPRWLGAQTIRLPPASWFGCFCLRNAIGYCPGRRTRRCWPRKLHYMTAFVLAHKMREAMASEMRGVQVGGAGRKAEIDGGYFGGYVKPANHIENRRDRRLRMNQSGKRKVVVVIRERDGKTLPGVFASEVAALNFIRTRIAKGTEVYADEGSAWNALHGRFTMHRINHQEAYSLGDGVHSNNAESFFSRMRRAEIGHHHHLAGPYLIRFAQEASWREDHRRDPNGAQVDRVVALAMRNKPSVDFCGYWQRSWASA